MLGYGSSRKMGNELKEKGKNKMISIRLDLWTNYLPDGSKFNTVWAGKGKVVLEKNESRGIKRTQVFFNKPEELLSKIQEVCKEGNINFI